MHLLGDCSLDQLIRRKSHKWRTYPPDVLPAFVAEMDFMVAEPIAEAVRDALALGDTGYPHAGDLGEAFASFAAAQVRLAGRSGPGLPDPRRDDRHRRGAGGNHAASVPAVVLNPPVYGPFFLRLGYLSRQVVEAPLTRRDDGGYDLDFDALDAALGQPEVSAYLLCNPHNPLGQVWRRTSCSRSPNCASGTRSNCSSTRFTRRWCSATPSTSRSPRSITRWPSGPTPSTRPPRAGTSPASSAGSRWPARRRPRTLLTDRWESLLASHHGVLASVGRVHPVARLARRGARPVGAEPGAAGQAAARAAARGRLCAWRGQLPGLAGLPRSSAWAMIRPPRSWSDGKVALTDGPYFGRAGRRVRAAQHRHLARADHRGREQDGGVCLSGG